MFCSTIGKLHIRSFRFDLASDLVARRTEPFLLLLFASTRIDATNTHFEMAERFEQVLRQRVNKVEVT
jgi:hypothetical protein